MWSNFFYQKYKLEFWRKINKKLLFKKKLFKLKKLFIKSKIFYSYMLNILFSIKSIKISFNFFSFSIFYIFNFKNTLLLHKLDCVKLLNWKYII